MKCKVTRLRQRGVRIPAAQAPAMFGELTVGEMSKSAFGRALRVARLTDALRPTGTPELVPPLFDVQLLKMTSDGFVLSGFEREEVGGALVDYAQTWLARFEKGK